MQLSDLPRSSFYYYTKQSSKNKYEVEEKEILNIFETNKGRYGYRRITNVLHNRGYHNITQSMSRKGNCMDNAAMENFFQA